eukprot:2092733-Pyramimonas_sp.AAC.2
MPALVSRGLEALHRRQVIGVLFPHVLVVQLGEVGHAELAAQWGHLAQRPRAPPKPREGLLRHLHIDALSSGGPTA